MAASGRRRKRDAFREPGASTWVCCKPSSLLLVHLCSTQASVSVQKRCFSLLTDSRIFSFPSFFFCLSSKGHCAQDALFLSAHPWCEGRKLTAFGRAADSHRQGQLAFAGHPFLFLFSEAFIFSR